MNVKMFSKLFFSFAAALALVAIAIACIAPLLSPVWPVIREVSPSPGGIIFARITVPVILCLAFLGAVKTARVVRLLNSKNLATYWTGFLNLCLSPGLFTAHFRSWNSLSCLGKMNSVAFQRTKQMPHLFDLRWRSHYFIPAHLTGYFNLCHFLGRMSLRGACLGAVNAWPALVIRKLFSALRAGSLYFGTYRGMKTSLGAKLFIQGLRGVNREFPLTVCATQCNHSLLMR